MPEIEIFPPNKGLISVTACPNPFEVARVEHEVPAGLSIAEILEVVQPDPVLRRFAHVSIGEHKVDPKHYRLVRPKPGTRLVIRMLPQGGRGGGGKGILGTILSIVVVIAAIAAPFAMPGIAAAWGGLAGNLISGGVMLVGGLVTNAIAGPSKPKLQALSAPNVGQERDSPTLSISGARNTLRPYSPVAVVLGRHWQVPALGAPTYTEVVGPDQYLRMVVIWGVGPLQVDTHKVGETSLSEFDGVQREFRRGYQAHHITNKGGWDPAGGLPGTAAFGDRYTVMVAGSVGAVTYAVGDTITFNGLAPINDTNAWDINEDKPLRLFPSDVVETQEQIILSTDWQTRTTAEDTDQISVDFTFYRGLTRFGDHGENQFVLASMLVEYAPTGTGSWTALPQIDAAAAQSSAYRIGRVIDVPRGQYDVRFKRTAPASTDNRQIDDVAVTAIRSVRLDPPFNHLGTGANPAALCCDVIRIKATEQLSGVVDNLSAMCTSIVPDWNGSAWIMRPTRNPASLYRHIYQMAGTPYPLSDDQINLVDLQWLHAHCDGNEYLFDHVVDYDTSVDQIGKDILAVARATPALRDNKQTFVADVNATVPVQAFTPANSWGFQSELVYPDLPHAYRVIYVDRESGNAREHVVYDDGYDANNATIYETLELTGVTSASHAHKLGRYHIAVARLRRQTVSFMVDFEGLVCTRGDLIRFTHQVPLWGLRSGRVLAVSGTGQIDHVTLDEEVTIGSGLYTIRFRTSGAGALMEKSAAVWSGAGTYTTIGIDPLPTGAIAPGDLYWIGETGIEHRNLRVHAITDFTEDHAARLVCVEDNPAIYTAESVGIPPYDPGLSEEVSVTYPRVLSVRSGYDVIVRNKDGGYQNRILITYALPAGAAATGIHHVQAVWRPVGATAWGLSASEMVGNGEISLPHVTGGIAYEIMLRFVRTNWLAKTPSEAVGPWSPIITHTVVADDFTPPNVTSFTVQRMADGTRRFDWNMAISTREVEAGGGYRIKYQSGGTIDWATAKSLTNTGLLKQAPFESNEIPAGQWTFGIVAVTATGVESSTPRTIVVTLGDPRIKNVLLLRREHVEGWPGTTDGVKIGDYLLAAPAAGSQWQNLTTWNTLAGVSWEGLQRASSLTYTTPVLDATNTSRDASFTPIIELVTTGNATIEMRAAPSAYGGNLSALPWGPVAIVQQQRYVQFRVTADGPHVREMKITLDADLVREDVEDVHTLTHSAPNFQRLGVGHFRIGSMKGISIITGAMVTAFQSTGAGWSSQLVSKDTTIAGFNGPAAEFKIYLNGVATDALVDIELKGVSI